eukprot:4833486-Amphidinium_carterae.1
MPGTRGSAHLQSATGGDIRVGPLQPFLLQQDKQKCAEYGLPTAARGFIRRDAVLCVLERGGVASPCALSFLHWLQQKRAQQVVTQGRAWQSAVQLAAHELWPALSIALLRSERWALQACTRSSRSVSSILSVRTAISVRHV